MEGTMKILITGATGFLGSHLTRALVNEGYQIIILKRSFSDTWRISDLLSKVEIFNSDNSILEKAFIEYGPIDVVIHTATRYDRNGEKFSDLLQSNVLFPLRLLETASAFETKLFINTDSFIHKYNQGYKHLAGYAKTKQQFLQWMKVYSSLEKIKLVNVKLEHVYGPFDNKTKFIPYIINSCKGNIPELNLTLGEQRRDFIHVNDVISAYLLLVKQEQEKSHWFNEYEVGTGNSVPLRQLVELIHEKTKSKTLLRFGALPYHENEIMDSKADNSDTKKLGWKYQINLDNGIEATISAEQS